MFRPMTYFRAAFWGNPVDSTNFSSGGHSKVIATLQSWHLGLPSGRHQLLASTYICSADIFLMSCFFSRFHSFMVFCHLCFGTFGLYFSHTSKLTWTLGYIFIFAQFSHLFPAESALCVLIVSFCENDFPLSSKQITTCWAAEDNERARTTSKNNFLFT